jgi:cobyrinic acid a,c-diamide synthase
VRPGRLPANAWRWQARDAVITEGFVSGRVHASYLHTHWNGVPGAASRITAAAREFREAPADRTGLRARGPVAGNE